jgi:hypothetical protein
MQVLKENESGLGGYSTDFKNGWWGNRRFDSKGINRNIVV